MKLGRTPHELLSAADAAEIAELFAYHLVMKEDVENEENERKLAEFVQGVGVAPPHG